MGGSGSGRWQEYTKKTTVEKCFALDINQWIQEKVLRLESYHQGTCTWSSRFGKELVTMGVHLMILDMTAAWVQLVYTCTQTGEQMDYPINLQATRPHYGGLRWWFTCPLVVNHAPCNQRTRKLYLPPRARYFGCRQCYNLTYRSCQENHVYDRLYEELTAEYGTEVINCLKYMLR